MTTSAPIVDCRTDAAAGGHSPASRGSAFRVLYADPPWNFGNRMYSSNKTDHHRAITRAYPVLTTKQLCEMQVKDIVADDSVCLMWTADAFVPDAIKVMESWGYKYKTVAFVWLKKERSGKPVCFMGCCTMKQMELVLLGTRGAMTQHLKSRRVRQLVEAPRDRTRHSGKPAIVREKIVEMFGDVPRIELFARERVPGWACWGNEVRCDVEIRPN